MAWSNSYYDGGFAPYVRVADRRAQAQRKARELEKGGRKLKPVVIEGRNITKTFWGNAWCEHIETHSDFASRLPRGRTYARNGSVIDLQIEKGQIRALVSGSEIYEIEIAITQLDAARWKALVRECAGKIDSVVELLTGELSDGVMGVLCSPDRGLFPLSKQLSLDCSCPDGARLCKHLAAVLYGVGARLDHEPELFFVLRGVDQMDLVGEATGGGVLGSRSTGASDLEPDALSEIFGIEMEQPAKKSKRVAKPARKSAARGTKPASKRRPRVRH